MSDRFFAKPTPLIEKDIFMARVETHEPGECWPWLGHREKSGYGVVSIKSQNYKAHRLSYRIFKGELDSKLVIDHTCRNRGCVNPEHLREVHHIENIMENSKCICAINKLKTHCKRGHPLSGDNIRITKIGGRACLACEKIKHDISYIKDRDAKREKARMIQQEIQTLKAMIVECRPWVEDLSSMIDLKPRTYEPLEQWLTKTENIRVE